MQIVLNTDEEIVVRRLVNNELMNIIGFEEDPRTAATIAILRSIINKLEQGEV